MNILIELYSGNIARVVEIHTMIEYAQIIIFLRRIEYTIKMVAKHLLCGVFVYRGKTLDVICGMELRLLSHNVLLALNSTDQCLISLDSTHKSTHS